jgi:hypothetical protein
MVTGIWCVSAATSAAALPATPEPTTSNRSFFLLLLFRESLVWIDGVPNPRLVELAFHPRFEGENDDVPIVGTLFQQDLSPSIRKVLVAIVIPFSLQYRYLRV